MKQEKVATDLVMHVLAAAERTGLITGDKTDRLSARVNHRLSLIHISEPTRPY